MLSKIRISENEILLHDSISGLSNIYNIDSLSLLIGENGSGKTRILCEIIKKFTSFKDRYYHDGCRVYDVDGVELFDYDLSNWGSSILLHCPIEQKLTLERRILLMPLPS
jgi:ABC-type cobalamin/Fe3+-siderophores transport system ATPase subunit